MRMQYECVFKERHLTQYRKGIKASYPIFPSNGRVKISIPKEKELSGPPELLSGSPCCLLQSSCLFNVVTVY